MSAGYGPCVIAGDSVTNCNSMKLR